MNTKTRVPGQAHDYVQARRAGGLPPLGGAKDTSGWKGPAKVIDISNISRGSITVRYQRDMPIE
eukprot:1840316-Alexandrium_andersonii.AAC.1